MECPTALVTQVTLSPGGECEAVLNVYRILQFLIAQREGPPETYWSWSIRPPQKSIPRRLEMGDDMGYHSSLCLAGLNRAASVYMGGELLFKIRLCF